jgi:hypothetical protein
LPSWIRIRIANPDPETEPGIPLNPDAIRIRIRIRILYPYPCSQIDEYNRLNFSVHGGRGQRSYFDKINMNTHRQEGTHYRKILQRENFYGFLNCLLCGIFSLFRNNVWQGREKSCTKGLIHSLAARFSTSSYCSIFVLK